MHLQVECLLSLFSHGSLSANQKFWVLCRPRPNSNLGACKMASVRMLFLMLPSELVPLMKSRITLSNNLKVFRGGVGRTDAMWLILLNIYVFTTVIFPNIV